MLNLSCIRLITFDITNTLLKFRNSPGKQYGDIGALYGVICDNKELAESFKLHWYKMNKEHPNFGLYSGLGWSKWWTTIIHGTFKDSKTCTNADYSKLDSIAADLISKYETEVCWEPTHGSENLLKYLKNKNIKLGVISNFDPRLTVILKNMKLEHHFDFVLTSYSAKCEKPKPDIFNKALEISDIEGVKGIQALHIGDSPTLDFLGATNAGWNSVLISSTSPKILFEKFPSLNEYNVFPSLHDFHLFLQSNEK